MDADRRPPPVVYQALYHISLDYIRSPVAVAVAVGSIVGSLSGSEPAVPIDFAPAVQRTDILIGISILRYVSKCV
jgi:hypothetical protein